MNSMTMDWIPDAWRSLGIRASASHDAFSSHTHYDSHRPYASYTSYESHRAYDSYHSMRSYSRSARHTKPTLVRRETFGASVCAPSGDPFTINAKGFNFIEEVFNLEIQTDDELMKHVICRKADAPAYKRFIDKCKFLGWDDAPFNWKNHGRPTVDTDGILCAPYSLYLYPSLRCNLRRKCNKCYVYHRAFPQAIMSPAEFKPIIEECVGLGVFHLTLLGGEPLLYPYLFELLQYAAELPLIVSMSSNGTLLSQRKVELLSQFIDRIQISLDGPDASTAEILKGNNTFDRTVSAIKRLMDVKLHTTVSYVLTCDNSSPEDIAGFVHRMAALGVHSLSFIQYYPSGDSAVAGRCLDVNRNIIVKNTLDSLGSEYKDLDISFEASFLFHESASLCDKVELYESTSLGCDCGRTRISIYPNGDATPCDFLANRSEFVAGNIFRASLGACRNTRTEKL